MGYGRSANPTDAIHKIQWASDDLVIAADTGNTITSNIIFKNDNTERMRIDSSGRVGIGTTSPARQLTVYDASTPIIQLANSTTGVTANDGVMLYESGSNFVIENQEAGEIKIYNNGSQRATIDSSGRLLVGTSSAVSGGEPSNALLQVVGRAGAPTDLARFTLARGNAATNLGSGSEVGNIYFTDNAGNTFSEISTVVDGTTGTNDYPGRLVFSTTADGASSPTERMRINSNGTFHFSTNGSYTNAGGTYNEIYQTNESVVCLYARSTSTNPYGYQIFYDQAKNNTGNEFLYCSDASAQRAAIRSNGGLANYQSNNINLCDEREKKNIVSLDTKWDKVKSWELTKFHYNEDADTDDKRYGVIAQQVEEHCPEVLTEWIKRKAADAVLDDEGNVVTPAQEEILRKGVKEQQMMWMAIKALQEAMERIETLEIEVASLRSN
jgi:hypothetical protein